MMSNVSLYWFDFAIACMAAEKDVERASGGKSDEGGKPQKAWPRYAGSGHLARSG